MKNTLKIIASLAGAALLITGVFVSFWAFNQIKESADARDHTFIVIHSANELLSALINAEIDQRGYLLTSDEVFLNPNFAVRDSINDQLIKLHQFTRISAARQHLEALAPLIDLKLSYLSHNIELRRKHNMVAVLTNIRGSQGKPLLDSIHSEMGKFIQIEEGALAHHDAEFKSNMSNLFILIIIASLLALSLVYWIYRETQRQLLTKNLRSAGEFAESVINTVREPLISLDQDLRVVTVSRSFYEFFKVKPEETVGHLIYDLGNKQWNIPKLRELLETILPQKASFDNYEVEHDFAGIGKRTMLLNARQIQQASGKERIILLAIEDITERKEIEAGLEKTRKELVIIKKLADEASDFAESVINTVREPLISLDQDLRVVTVSRSFYEFFKVKPEETVGQLIYDLGNKQWDIPKLRELLETILPQKASFDNYEVEHVFAGIGKRTMLLNARQIQQASGKERIILLAIEDITERKEIEAGLEKTRKELVIIKKLADEASDFAESVINTVREPLISLDQDLRVVTVSRSFYEFFKVKPEETVGQLIYDLGNKQWDIPKLRELLETILPKKTSFDNYEVEHDFTTIGRRTMLLNARQIQQASGKERIILLAIEDITERKEIEAGLEKTRKELEVANKELEAFSYSVSHDLRAPLRHVSGYVELLAKHFKLELSEKGQHYLDSIADSASQMGKLIDNLLQFSRTGRADLRRSDSDMNVIVQEAVELWCKDNPDRTIEWTVNKLPSVLCDTAMLRLVWMNLLSNAVKFTRTRENASIEIGAKDETKEVIFFVKDNGVGFDMKYAQKLFGVFQRLHPTEEFEGTGIGLANVNRIIIRHGGRVWAEAELNKGATFYFSIPK